MPINVAIVGCGYWGPNLVRNFHACDSTAVLIVCDPDSACLASVAPICPDAKLVTHFDEVLSHPGIDAVVIATPVGMHAKLTCAALEAGKHVLVEKPMADNVNDAEEMLRLAEQNGLTLMVDHTYLYSPPVRKAKELLDSGSLGKIYYIDSVRINLGLFQSDVNVVWDLAPHDLSIVDHLVGRLPKNLTATGVSHTASGLEDVAYLSLDFGDSLISNLHVNWLSPVKIRHMIIAGSKKSLMYDHLQPVEPIKVYDRGIEVAPTPEARRGLLVSYRTGDIWSPRIPNEEPLRNVVEHFADCITKKQRPLSDGHAGLRVVRMLAAAEQSIRAQGERIPL